MARGYEDREMKIYRMEVAGEEMFIDLLFFNRELNSLVAVELKSVRIQFDNYRGYNRA